MKITPKVGYLMQFIGIFHIILGVVLFPSEWYSILSDGGFNSVGMDIERNNALWFTFLGVPFVTIGSAWNYIQKYMPEFKSNFMGWHLLLMGLLCGFFVPISGAWFLIILGAWMLLEN
jgi:Family of unknown function (DUF6463)